MYKNPNPKSDWKPHETVYFWDIQGMELQHGTIAVVVPDGERTILYIKSSFAEWLIAQDADYCFINMKTAVKARTDNIVAASEEIGAKLKTPVDIITACFELVRFGSLATSEDVAKSVAIQRRTKELFGVDIMEGTRTYPILEERFTSYQGEYTPEEFNTGPDIGEEVNDK